MAPVEIAGVELVEPGSGALLKANVELPAAGATDGYYVFRIAGWTLTRGTRPKSIDLWCGGVHFASVGYFVERPDVSDHFSEFAGAVASGFLIEIDSLPFPEQFEIIVSAGFENGASVDFAVVRGRHEPLAAGYTPWLKPIPIFGMGRSGSTLLMRYLLNHPQIAAFDRYPYEMLMLIYALQAFGIHTARADHHRSVTPETIMSDQYRYFVGINPFNSPGLFGETVGRWFNDVYLRDYAAFNLRSLDSFYQAQAIAQGKSAVSFYAEKMHSAGTRGQYLWTLYPGARGVLLVRDLRDWHASAEAFNRRVGIAGFGFDIQANTSEEFVAYIAHGLRRLIAVQRLRSPFILLVRYEDLVRNPREWLAKIAAHVGADASAPVIEATISRADVDDPALDRHRTSDPGQSIGRWKRDLDPVIAQLYAEQLGDLLAELGYEV